MQAKKKRKQRKEKPAKSTKKMVNHGGRVAQRDTVLKLYRSPNKVSVFLPVSVPTWFNANIGGRRDLKVLFHQRIK